MNSIVFPYQHKLFTSSPDQFNHFTCDLSSNSPCCLSYNSHHVSLENLALDQLIKAEEVKKSTFFSILLNKCNHQFIENV